MISTNTNCLRGIRCPKCGQDDVFRIQGTAVFTVVDDGTDEFENVEWDEDAPTTCPKCGYDGLMEEFQEG